MVSCPCGSGLPLEGCCAPLIAGDIPAATAEALMRARYTAFIQQDLAYLDRTLAPEKRAEFDQDEVGHSAGEAVAVGIEVRAATGGGPEDQTGTLEYIARFKVRGHPHLHHELASFRREDGAWVYVEGTVSPKTGPRTVSKVGRNDPCPCGSGRKHKTCCGR
jgi:SEC-C motif-containing protein